MTARTTILLWHTKSKLENSYRKHQRYFSKPLTYLKDLKGHSKPWSVITIKPAVVSSMNMY